MISSPITNENIAVLTPNGIKFLQTEKPTPTNQSQKKVEKYLKTEVKVVGTIQILCGVMVLFLGIILTSASYSPYFTEVFSSLLKATYPFIGALCFITSGSLSIITEKKSMKTLVRCCLVVNVLSSLFALVGFIFLSVNLADLGPTLQRCDLGRQNISHEHPFNYHSMDDVMDCTIAKTILAGVLSMILICTLVEFFLAVLMTRVWWGQHLSDFPGSVIFLPQHYQTITSMPQKGEAAYEELLT